MTFSLPKFSGLRKFFVRAFATLGFFVFMSFFIGIILGAAMDKRTIKLPKDIVLYLNLEGGLTEQASLPTLSNPFVGGGLTLHQIIFTLDRARDDDRVHGLYVRLETGDYGLAQIQELRDAVDRFQLSGKFAYLFSDDLNGLSSAMGEYYLASTFDEIWMQPVGSIGLTGFHLQMPFIRGMLDKIGIEPEVIAKGTYKSAPEMFERKTISPANLEMSQSLIKNFSNQFLEDVSLDRDFDRDTLKTLIDQAPHNEFEALKASLIDSVGYWDEFLDHIEAETPGETTSVNLKNYRRGQKTKTPKDTTHIAIIKAVGAITNFNDGAGVLSSETAVAEDIWDAFNDAMNHNDVKAIILRIDSPGGSPTASETIRRAVQLARKKKPVIVSMGNAAASGGYWIAAPANVIVAQPSTLTGSIGVFAMKPNFKPLWDKIGVNWDDVTYGKNADLWSTNQPLSATKRAKLQSLIDHTYDQFIERVADGRRLPKTVVEKIAQGRVWTGDQAHKRGLVDHLGGMETAIIQAKKLIDLEEEAHVSLVPFPQPLSPVQQIIKLANDSFVAIPNFMKMSLRIDQFLSWIQSGDFVSN